MVEVMSRAKTAVVFFRGIVIVCVLRSSRADKEVLNVGRKRHWREWTHKRKRRLFRRVNV